MATGGKYQVYLSRFINGSWETYVELEDTFPGMIYKSCEGLEGQGEPKFYSEEYAESSVPRVVLTNKVKPRDIEFEFLFKNVPAHGTTPAVDKFAQLKAFTAYITGYKFKFYDSVRGIKADMYLSGPVEVSESFLHEGQQYIIASFPCTSLNGENLT